MTVPSPMYYRVFSHCLDSNTNWYALNSSLPGIGSLDRHYKSHVFEWFPKQVKRVDIRDLRTKDGKSVPATAFNSKAKRSNLGEVYVLSTFAISVFALRQRQIDGNWLNSTACGAICATVNMVSLEDYGANNTDAESMDSSSEVSTMSMHVALLENKIQDQKIRIDALGAEYNNKNNENLKIPALITSPRSSTTRLLASEDITPPEKKRRLKEKGQVVLNTLKDVSAAYHEDIFSIFGNLVSEDKSSEATNILRGASDVIFSHRGAREGLELVLSDKSREALAQSFRQPDWVYVYLKLKIRLSDLGWQTLLNLTQLGRSMVS